MNLYILRHGIAENRGRSSPAADAQRRLTPVGAKKMLRIAEGMKGAKLEFDLILTSPYPRAKETAAIVADVFGAAKKLEVAPALVPHGNPKQLIDDILRHHPDRKDILLVGHEPYLSRLISLLLTGDTRLPINLKKSGWCKLAIDKLQYGRCASLHWLLTPRQMKRMKR